MKPTIAAAAAVRGSEPQSLPGTHSELEVLHDMGLGRAGGAPRLPSSKEEPISAIFETRWKGKVVRVITGRAFTGK